MNNVKLFQPKWIILSIFLLIMVVPFLWLLLASFKTSQELFSNPFGLPTHLSFENYWVVLTEQPIFKYFLNSIFVAVVSTFLAVASSTLGSFVFKFHFKMKSFWFVFISFGIFIPINAFMTPYFFIVNGMGLYDNLFGLALVYTAMSTPMCIFIIKTYMDTIPNEIMEAAFMDGASIHKTFFKIILPMSVPGMVTASIFAMITAWNELLFATVLTESDGTRTLQVAIRFFLSTFQANYPEAFAAMVISILPTIIIYIFLSEKIIGGLTAGAIK